MQLYSNGDYQIAPKAMFSFVPLFKLKAKHFFLCFLIVTTLNRLNWPTYSRVHKSPPPFFSKILEEPSIVQKKMIPHIQRDLSGSSECRRLVDNLIGRILDWNQRGWKGNVLNFFVRLSDWQNFEFCNHFWGKIDNGDNFLPILGLRAGLVSVTASRALNRTLCFSNMAINELKNIQWRLCLKLHHTTHC